MNTSNLIRYLIIGKTRSGTTLTHIAIRGHPNATGFSGELKVDPFFTKGITTFSYAYASENEKINGFSSLFDAISQINADHNTSAIGCKTATNSPKSAVRIVDTIQSYLPNLKIIIIIRNDLVANYGSAISGSKSGIMHSWRKGFKTRVIKSIKINKYLFTYYVINSLKYYDVLRKLKNTHDVLEIYYEDILSDSQRVYHDIFKFLGLSPIEVTWMHSEKVMPKPEEYIKNYAEMKILQHRLEKQYKHNSIPSGDIFISKVISKVYKLLKPKYKQKSSKSIQH